MAAGTWVARERADVPPKNFIQRDAEGAAGIRPDFRFTTPRGDTLAWAEVECGADAAQAQLYRRQLAPDRVITIWGRRSAGGDSSLEAIREHLGKDAHRDNPFLRYLSGLIDETTSGRARAYNKHTAVSESMRENDFIKRFEQCVGGRLQHPSNPNRPLRRGDIVATTVGQNGYSLHVYSAKGPHRWISIFWITGGSPDVWFPSAEKLTDYLPAGAQAIARLSELASECGAEQLMAVDYRGRTPAPIGAVAQRAERLAEIVLDLAPDPLAA